jgi:hypothetical protein
LEKSLPDPSCVLYQAQEPVRQTLVNACPESCLVWDTGLLSTPVGIARKYWKWSSSITNGADPRIKLLQNTMQSKKARDLDLERSDFCFVCDDSSSRTTS